MTSQNNPFYDGEYMETTTESVYRYAPKQRYTKAILYMEKYFGLPNEREIRIKDKIPAMQFDDGRIFHFDDLHEVCYYFPFGKPEKHGMTVVNSSGTIFAFGNGQIHFAKGNKFIIV